MSIIPAILDNVAISLKANIGEQNRKNTGCLKLHELFFPNNLLWFPFMKFYFLLQKSHQNGIKVKSQVQSLFTSSVSQERCYIIEIPQQALHKWFYCNWVFLLVLEIKSSSSSMPDPEKLGYLSVSSSFSSFGSQPVGLVFDSVPVMVTYISSWAGCQATHFTKEEKSGTGGITEFPRF